MKSVHSLQYLVDAAYKAGLHVHFGSNMRYREIMLHTARTVGDETEVGCTRYYMPADADNPDPGKFVYLDTNLDDDQPQELLELLETARDAFNPNLT